MEPPEDEQKSDDMARTMGFSSFGGTKKAKQFDFMAMFEKTRNTAIERSKPTLAAREADGKTVTKTKKPSSKSSSSSDSDSDSPGSSTKQSRVKHSAKHTQKLTDSLPPSMQKSSLRDPEDDDGIGPPLPAWMQKTSKPHEKDDSDDEDIIGPPLPPSMRKSTESETMGPPVSASVMKSAAHTKQHDSDDEDDDDDDNPLKKIPSSHEITLNHGGRTVSALALDPSGARLVSGGYDYEVKFWDFAGMDASLQSFRGLRPCECHAIKSLEYSMTGDRILVVAGNAQAKILDRDGFEVMECKKGDQYINDMRNTKGHTAMLNAGCWSPKVKEEFMTCSNDGTARLWDVNKGDKQKGIIKFKSQQGRRTIPTACTYSRDGVYVAAACQDGSIQIWDNRKTFVNVAMLNRTAHMNGSETSCLCFSYDNRTLASRGGDDTLKLWDIRNFKKPLQVADDLLNIYSMTDCLFSPDDQLVVTSTSVKKGETGGKLVFMDRNTLQRLAEIEVSETSAVRCLWHPRLNQMAVGDADGAVKIFYDPTKSHRGAMLCVIKPKRQAKQIEGIADQNIITPHALPMFRQARPTSTRRKDEKDRKDPIISHRPDLPVAGQGVGGRVGAKGATLSQYICQNLVLRKPDFRDKDPRAAILRHAKEASENPYWVDPAYKKTQPEAIWHKEEDSEEEDDGPGPRWKKAKLS